MVQRREGDSSLQGQINPQYRMSSGLQQRKQNNPYLTLSTFISCQEIVQIPFMSSLFKNHELIYMISVLIKVRKSQIHFGLNK